MKKNNILRRDFLKGLSTLPFLGWFAFGFKDNITREITKKQPDYHEILRIKQLDSPKEKLIPSAAFNGKQLRFGLVGNGWRGEQLLHTLSYAHPETIEKNTSNGKLSGHFQQFVDNEDVNVEFAGVCDTFKVYADRGAAFQSLKHSTPPIRIYKNYREMIADHTIDAILIATPDHTHAQIAIDAAKAGKHIYLEKPMTHTIEEAVELRNVIKDTGVVFQLGHENRQQMSFKIGREMYRKGVLGDVTLVRTNTHRNSPDGAWIRNRPFEDLANEESIDWKEFLGKAEWQPFDKRKYFNWQRYSQFGTSITGNNFSHQYDCINQVLNLGIPESVVAIGGQHYYKGHGDIPDVLNAVFHYPDRGLAIIYDASLKHGIYRPSQILGSEARMDIDREIRIFKDNGSKRYKNIETHPGVPIYHYEANKDVDAFTSATAQAYIAGGYGPTYIDGKVIDATYLHLKEWFDAIRTGARTSCNIDVGFEEAVTFNLANLAYCHKQTVTWDKMNEKAIIG
ncbi:MAG: Gfo/Idh/MocA family oxidoreductase [Mariniphaga sp.]